MEKHRIITEIAESLNAPRNRYWPYDSEKDRFDRKYNRFKNGNKNQRKIILKRIGFAPTKENLAFFDTATDEQILNIIRYYDEKRRERNAKR